MLIAIILGIIIVSCLLYAEKGGTMKYTKGYWKVGHSRDEIIIYIEELEGVIASLHVTPTNLANANLIAAAPDMYEACQKLVAWDNSHDDSLLISEACSLARLSLLKVEGKEV